MSKCNTPSVYKCVLCVSISQVCGYVICLSWLSLYTVSAGECESRSVLVSTLLPHAVLVSLCSERAGLGCSTFCKSKKRLWVRECMYWTD